MTGLKSQNIFNRCWFRYLSVLIPTVCIYLSTLRAGFVQWDDRLVTENLALRGLSLEHILGIILPQGTAYQPVRNLAFAITYQFSLLDPFGYHLVNLLLYLVAVGLAYRVLEVLVEYGSGEESSKKFIPWVGAAIFAFHPLHVEAVAWIVGNKDLLVTVFFLAAFLSYEKYTSSPRKIRYYWLAYFFFLLALGSKPTAAAFPLVILSFDLIFQKQWSGNEDNKLMTPTALILRHLPYWLPAIFLALYFIFFTTAVERSYPLVQNLLALPKVLWTYYRLLLLPTGLLHRYLDPEYRGLADTAFLAGLILTAAILCFLWRRGKKQRLLAFGIVWFYLCWLPQSGIVPIVIRVADRYVFISILGFSLCAAILLAGLWKRVQNKGQAGAVHFFIIIVCALLALLSAKRCLVWRDGISLWSDGVAKEPGSGYFYKGLANAYLEREELDRAFEVFQKAVFLSPYDTGILNNMAYILKEQGRLADAEKVYQRTLSIDPSNFNAWNSLGNSYAQEGKDSLAISCYLKALEIGPDNYMASTNLATIYRKFGNKEEADRLMQELEKASLPQPVVLLRRGMTFVEEGRPDSARLRFERALALDKGLVQAYAKLGEIYLSQDSLIQALHNFRLFLKEGVPDWSLYHNLALAFERLNQPDSALLYYRRAYELAPDSSTSTLNLAVLLNRMDKTGEAVYLIESYLQARPTDFIAHYNLANWLVRLGKYREAAGHYRQSLELNPNDPKIHLNLGLVLIQFLGQPEEGAAHLEKSLELDPDQPQAQHIKDTIAYLKNRR